MLNHIFMLSLNLEAASYFFLFPGCDEINNIQIYFENVREKKRYLATLFDRFLL